MTAILDTVILETDLVSTQVPPRRARPQLKAVIVRVAASLVTAVVAPAVLFTTTLVVVNVVAAVIVALAWMVGAMCWRWATGRPVSGLLVLALGTMTVKTAFTLATGNTFVYFVQPVFTDATVAAVFLGSLWTDRPIVARIAPDFYPIDAALAARPRIRRLFRQLTLLWGLVIVIKGSLTLWLLLSMSTVNFVLIKSSAIITLTLTAAAATIALSAIVARREGLLRPTGVLVWSGPRLRKRSARPLCSTAGKVSRDGGLARLDLGRPHIARSTLADAGLTPEEEAA